MKKLLFILLLFPFIVLGQPVAVYEMENNANDSAGTYNGVAKNITYGTTDCPSGTYYAVFNGTNTKIASDGTAFSFANTTFTVSFLGRTTVTVRTFVCHLDNSGIDGWRISTSGAALMRNSSGTTCSRLSQKSFADGAWHHIVVIFTTSTTVVGDNNISIYVDGIDRSGTLVQNAVYSTPTDSLRVGYQFNSEAISMTGEIDDIIIEQRAWTAADVYNKYTSYTIPRTISAWWMNGDATDRIGANNGVAHNMTYVAGMQGQAGNFNGTNGYIATTGTGFAFGTTTWTVSAIIKTTQTATRAICGNGLYDNAYPQTKICGWIFGYWGTKGIYGALYPTSGTANISYSTTLPYVNDGTWHHVVGIFTQDLVTLNNNNVLLYIDGKNRDSLMTRIALPSQGNDSLRIGTRRFSSYTYWSGQIDDVIIEQRAWTAAEIKQKYLYYKGLMSQ